MTAWQAECTCRSMSQAFRTCMHSTTSEPLAQPEQAHDLSFLHEQADNGIVLLRYPADCRTSTFQQQYINAAQRMAKLSWSFGLVHDLRGASLLSLRVDEISNEAAAIASKGFVRRVALVLDVNPLLRAAIAAGVFAQSPVRPVRCFEHLSEACAWAGDWRDMSLGREGMAPDFGMLEQPRNVIKIHYRPFYTLNRLLGGQELANERAKHIDLLRGFSFELVLPGARPHAQGTRPTSKKSLVSLWPETDEGASPVIER